ncbi:MAG: 23S rRNA (adenine(2503)-C(2))-methyltransferase RlmN [Epulopiscium sp.]|nr:23S rRNA (adenine(2503)-C(2))-methyltransferase RlmN [Candidatus Epulonipiscium sp.]
MQDLQSITPEELEKRIVNLGEKPFRAKQIFKWLHQHHIKEINEMTNISKELRQQLLALAPLCKLQMAERYESQKDETIKYLFTLSDHNIIECVLMRYNHGNTVCISSQVGCRMGCKFCASTLDGLVRHLSAGEMVSQIYAIQEDIGERISNVVIMGSGEPLDNFQACIDFITIITSPLGLNIGQRHITISTCGLIPQMRQLALKQPQVTLAVSLHAPNDAIRQEFMPIARKYSLDELLATCAYYIEQTHRRITFEYALIQGYNDQEQHAKELGQKLKGLLCHVNLIPMNEIEERSYISTTASNTQHFKKILEEAGITVTIRRKLGEDIAAACGQLRRGYLSK